jgi:hypothetical protein
VNSDFKEFQDIEPVSPPRHLSEAIISRVRGDLNPSSLKVFAKLSSIHFFVGAFTLAICPQFGFRLFGDGPGLMGYFMNLGHYACMIACGSFFLGSSVLVAGILLKKEELRVVRANRFTQFTSLALLSLGFFIMFDTQILALYAVLWMIGSVFAAVMVTEAISAVRLKFQTI